MNKTKTQKIIDLEVRSFYEAYSNDRTILRDFYKFLPEDKYDFRLLDTKKRKSDSPRESLVHIIEVQLMYLAGIKTGKLVFKDMGLGRYLKMAKKKLLEEMDKVDQEMFAYLNSSNFDSKKIIITPWGGVSAIEVLNAFRSHEILHQGWNLALMDLLDMPRFESLKNTWG